MDMLLAEITQETPHTSLFQPTLSSKEHKMMLSYAIASTEAARAQLISAGCNFLTEEIMPLWKQI